LCDTLRAEQHSWSGLPRVLLAGESSSALSARLPTTGAPSRIERGSGRAVCPGPSTQIITTARRARRLQAQQRIRVGAPTWPTAGGGV